jgi:pimeloyl-ACP methyl ester carboxylesterase
MRWRSVLKGSGALLGAAAGAAATYNVAARRGVAALRNPIGGEDGYFTWRGYRVAYTRHGSGPALLLVHGIHAAASSFEWRQNVESLAASHTVYAIDLLGFGRSDRPGVKYTARLYLALLTEFATKVVREPCVLVASSLAGAYGIVLAARDAARFPALIAVAPTGLRRLSRPASATGDVARLLVDTPVLGTAMFNALVSRDSLRHFLLKVYAENGLVTDALVERYYQTAHQPGARHAPAAFISGQLNIDVRDSLRRLVQPMLIVWGAQAVEAPIDDLLGFRSLRPDAEVSIIERAGDLPHDERPREFNRTVVGFLERVGVGV